MIRSKIASLFSVVKIILKMSRTQVCMIDLYRTTQTECHLQLRETIDLPFARLRDLASDD